MKNNRIIIIATIAILLLISYTIYKVYIGRNKIVDYSKNLNVYAFDVGKADSFLIRKDDSVIMIDTAEERDSTKIISYLNANDINQIDYLIITHFDKDHVGSAAKIIETIDVKHVLHSNVPKDSEYYKKYIEELKDKDITPVEVTNNYTFELAGVSYYVIGPKKVYEKKSSNNSSLIVDINYKNNNLLFMGDAMDDRIKDFIDTNKKTYDFIKIPYHGNFQKTLMDLLEDTNPKYAIVSSSKDKEDEELINLLKYKGIKYYLTRTGDKMISFDGNNIYVEEY